MSRSGPITSSRMAMQEQQTLRQYVEENKLTKKKKKKGKQPGSARDLVSQSRPPQGKHEAPTRSSLMRCEAKRFGSG